MGTCTICSNNESGTYAYAERYLRRANSLLEDQRLTEDQRERLQSTIERLNVAIINTDTDAVRQYTQTLRSYYYDISDALR